MAITPLTATFAMGINIAMLHAIKHPVPDRVKSSFCNFRHPSTLALRAECQSDRVAKFTITA